MIDGAHETQTRIAKLEQEIEELKRKLTRVFTVLDVSTTKEPFLRLMISLDATEAQQAAVYDLMHELDGQISTSQPALDHFEFCARVDRIFPGQQPQHLAEAIVTHLARDDGWERVYQHLRRSGMKLRDLREERVLLHRVGR
jgi:hypothetical protein